MKVLQSQELLDNISDIIHEDTQLHSKHFDLTISEIYQYTGAGSLDFGGSEFNPAASKLVHPKKKNADDDYGWWHLEDGTYKAVFNESLDLSDNSIAVISPHPHSEEAGLIISTLFFSTENKPEQISINFQVPVVGCNIKENARFATLSILNE